MVDYYLKDLVTLHPGGWQDIIDYVNKNFDRYKATYKTVDMTVSKELHTTNSGNASVERLYRQVDGSIRLPRLEEIKHPVRGIVASMGWVVLNELSLPLPGSKEWLKPCSQWRANEKG